MESLEQKALNHSINSEKTSSRDSTSAADDAEASIHYYDVHQSITQNIINPSSQTTCDICRRDITFYTHLLCEWGDFCVPCFSSLDKFPQEYHVIGHLNFPLIDEKWSANEELLLLSAMERYGYGNWVDIKTELGTSKSIQEIQDHYERILETPFNQLEMSINSIKGKNTKNKAEYKTHKTQKPKNRNEHNMLKQQIQNSQLHNIDQNKMRMVGLTVKRGDFQIEYDNDLQLLIAEMQFTDSDTPSETQMKYNILDIFNQRLNKRNQVKDFVIQRRLLDLYQLNKKDRGKSKQERDVAVLLRPYARFLTNWDYERLCEGIAKQNQLKKMLISQKQQRSKGGKSGSNFNQENLSRKRSISAKKKLKSKQDTSKLSLITQEQFELCTRFGITQISFMMVKSTIKSICSRNRSTQAKHFHQIFKMDPTAINQIFAYLRKREGDSERA